jgi:tetratricopeptide (TPR) repeat protein
MRKGSSPPENEGRKRRWRVLTILALLLLIGSGLFLAGANLWAWHHFNAARNALEIGDYAQAEKHLNRCLMVWSGDGQVYLWKARTARCLGNLDQAENYLRKCEDLKWSPEGIDLEEMLLRARRGEFAELEPTLIELTRKDNEDGGVVMEMLANSYARNGQIDAAMYWSNRFLKHSPNNVPALLLLGNGYHLLRVNIPEALKYFRKAVEIQPDNESARRELAGALLDHNEPQQALEQYQELMSRGVHAREVLLGLARSYRALGHGKKAKEIIDELVQDFPQFWEAWNEQGRLALENGNLVTAEVSFRKSLALHPHEPITLYSLYLCLRRKGRAKQAEATECHARYKKLAKDIGRLQELLAHDVSQHPNDPAICFEAATLCIQLGQENTGLHWLQRTLQLQPSHPGARKALAAYYQKIDRKNRAATNP